MSELAGVAITAAGSGKAERLCTVHGTVLYIDESCRELRHGAIDGSPANALLIGEAAIGGGAPRGRVMHDAGPATQQVLCGAERSVLPAGVIGVAPAQIFEKVPLEAGFVGLRLNGVHLCAEPDGRVTYSRRECGPWERFRALDRAAALDTVPECAAVRAQALAGGGAARRYHLGCGPVVVPGWMNIDQRADLPREGVFQVENMADGYFCNHDLSRSVPGIDNSLELVYQCHFLEHLAYADATRLLRNVRLRLRPGGRMRLLVPDLELWVRNYAAGNSEFFAEYRRMALGDNARAFPTNGSVFIGMMHNFGHSSGYDFETLRCFLEEAGFTGIRRTGYQESDFPDIRALEPRNPLRELESLCIECIKPAE